MYPQHMMMMGGFQQQTVMPPGPGQMQMAPQQAFMQQQQLPIHFGQQTNMMVNAAPDVHPPQPVQPPPPVRFSLL